MANKLYLLSGNGSINAWWEDTLPYFQETTPIPLELPGFGDNPSDRFHSISQLADALIEMTEPGHPIFAAGVNGLVALHALARRPGHFSTLYLLAPVGAFLWKRRFVKLMSPKPVRKLIHYLLRTRPKLFARKFSSKKWTDAQYRRMGEGYGKCKAFQEYFDFVNPVEALDLLEYVTDRVVLIWGRNDAVLGLKQAAAWDSILPRAELEVVVKEDWEHYPYIDDPKGFAEDMEAGPAGWTAHSKAGRLQLADLAGLEVPKSYTATSKQKAEEIVTRLKGGRPGGGQGKAGQAGGGQVAVGQAVASPSNPTKLYAVRSSGANEDQIDNSHAGRHHSFLRVPVEEIAAKAAYLLEGGLEEVAIQEFIEPKISGVAFVRGISAEVEMVAGHLEELVSGTKDPTRFVASKLGGEWEVDGLSTTTSSASTDPHEPIDGDTIKFRKSLTDFLHRAIAAFHFIPSDIEWAWDGQRFHLLQLRPVTTYHWRRVLTSANLDEILPKQVSRLMENAQRQASLSIGRLYALWDPATLDANEPFSVVHEDASYINLDLFLSRFKSWGLPSNLLAKEIGGAVPKFGFNPLRFIRNIPRFLKMQGVIRRGLLRSGERLAEFEAELDRILAKSPTGDEDGSPSNGSPSNGSPSTREADLVHWFTRFYIFIVRQNMLINASLSASGGKFLGKGKTVYHDMQNESSPHRLTWESDPATPREKVPDAQLVIPSFPPDAWPAHVRFVHWLRGPGLGGYYFEVREWFRDSNMRLFHRLHHALKGSAWLEPHPGTRTRAGTFWQDGGGDLRQEHGFVIYPGGAQGTVGKDILIVDALDPGQFETYKAAKAVVARMGGRLSHGSTLLRELGKPSAILPDAPEGLEGQTVHYKDGVITLEKNL